MAGTPRSGSGFINFSDFVGANQGAINRTRGAMLDPLNKKLANAATDEAYGMEDLQRNTGANALQFDPATGEQRALELGGASYGGPNSAMDDANFSHAFGDAFSGNKDAQRANNAYGRAGALRDQFGAGNPTYGAGQQLFDSALLGAGAGKGAYEQTAKTAGHLFDKFQKDAGTLDASIAAAKTGTTAAAGQYKAQGEQLRADRVKREADAAQSQKDAQAWQDSPWAKKLRPRPGTPAKYDGSLFNAGVAGGYTGP